MSEIAARIAARALRAEGLNAEAEAVVAKLPRSGPGLDMVKGQLEKLNKAYESGDGDEFAKALDELSSSHAKLAARK